MTLTVLQYHKLHPIRSDDGTIATIDFNRQLSVLKEKGYNSISCKELFESIMQVRKLPEKPVLITFDEGHISQYRYAIPVLESHSFRAVFFVTGECVLKSADRQYQKEEHKMGIDQLRHIQEIGFEIGLHGFSNINYRHSALWDIQSDISRMHAAFRGLQLPLTNALAFPGGKRPAFFSLKARRLNKLLQREKILLAFVKGNQTDKIEKINRFNIHRIEVSAGMSKWRL